MRFIQSTILVAAGLFSYFNGFGQGTVDVKAKASTSLEASRFDIQIFGQHVPDTATVYVRYITDKKLTLAPIHFQRGEAKFQAMITEPTLIMLFLARDGAGFNAPERKVPVEKLSFYADPKERGVSIRFTGSIKDAKVVSGNLEKEFQQYSDYLKSYDEQLEILFKERGRLYEPEKDGRDEVAIGKVTAAIEREWAVKDSAKLEFAKQYPNSYFALLGLKEAVGYHIDAKQIEPIFRGLSQELQESPMGVAFGREIALAHKLRVGQPAPDFLQYDTSGRPVRLSDFRGKYVLLDFWASWCGPCRAQNPQVVALYNKMKGKNFEIVGISLDNQSQRAKWLKAIKDDHLTWVQVSDLKGWENQAAKDYGIKAVPQNYLVGPDGKIVGEDMEMEEVVEKCLRSFLSTFEQSISLCLSP